MTLPPPSRKPMSPLAIILALSGTFFVLFVILTGGVYMTRSSGRHTESKKSSSGLLSGASQGSVGVIELSGVIMDSKKMLKKLEDFDEDGEVKAVVLRLNSPGGAVAPSQEIYEAVKAYKKPLVVSMASVAASGAYYIASGAKKVYANPGTITGSIGVIMEFVSLEKLYEWAKVKRYAIKTGKFKAVGAEYKDMTDEERSLMQGMIDDVLAQFRKAVADGRKLPMERVIALSDGRIFSGNQALAAKLVDELGTLQDAVNDAAKLAGIEGKPSVVYPERKGRNRLLELLLDEGGAGDHDGDASAGHVDPAVGLVKSLVQVVIGSGGSTAPGGAASGAGILPAGAYVLWKGAY